MDDDSLRWLGTYCYERQRQTPGMRGGVALTAVRGLGVETLLQRLGAARGVGGGTDVRYRDFDFPTGTGSRTPCMYGVSGEWSYVLEDSGSATWYERWFNDDHAVKPRPGEEMVCINPNIAVQPCWLVYAPGDGAVWFTEFGESPLDIRRKDATGKVAVLDEALRAAGAVNPGRPEFGDVPEWTRFVDANLGGVPAVVWQAVSDCLGIRIPRADVEEGNLPVALLDDPYA